MMNKKQYSVLVVLVVVSGMIGGGLSNWLLSGNTAFATKTNRIENAVTTEELRIVDKSGREHITLGLNTEGEPRLVVWDINNNRSSIILGLDNNKSPSLTFWDSGGKSRASLCLSPEGDPRLRFIDKDGKTTLATFGTSADGNPELFLFDKDGNKRAKFCVLPDETSIGFVDKDGKTCFGLGILTETSEAISETPVLHLLDNRGENMYWAWRTMTSDKLAVNFNEFN